MIPYDGIKSFDVILSYLVGCERTPNTVSAQIRGRRLIKKLGFYGEDFTK